MHTFKKWILLTHRYLGLSLSLLFVMWFVSGFVMMYVQFPTMKHHQRLQQLPLIDLGNCRVSPQQAIQQAGIKDTLKSIRLGMLLNRPVYRVVTRHNEHITIFADSGRVLGYTDTVRKNSGCFYR
jgi:hypothetical protein